MAITPLHILITVGVLSAVYLALTPWLPFTGDFAIKALPILILAGASLYFVPGTAGKLLCLGLVLSSGGDISLSFEGEKSFLIGLGFFLLAHIAYVVNFFRSWEFQSGRLPILVVLLVFAVGMAIYLSPKLGEMRIPVFVYISVILAMGVTATFWKGPRPNLLLIGAIVFMLSDSMIALNKFAMPISWSKYFIMVTYYAAQMMIWFSFVPRGLRG